MRLAGLNGLIERHPYRVLAAYFAVTVSIYRVASHHALYGPIPVGPTQIDDWIPVVPATAYFYMTYVLVIPSVIMLRRPGYTDVFRSGAFCVLANLAFNILVPTSVEPRIAASDYAGTFLGFVLAHDGNMCAFPSGHIALPTCVAVSAARAGWRGAWAYALWAAGLGWTALTTGQHYVPDVVGGVVWGAACARVARRWETSECLTTFRLSVGPDSG